MKEIMQDPIKADRDQQGKIDPVIVQPPFVRLPRPGDILYLSRHGYGIVESAFLEGSNYVVYFYALVEDYTNEGGYLSITQPASMLLTDFVFASASQKNELKLALGAKNLVYDSGYKRVIHKAINRVPTGTRYWYIDTDMAERQAVDDGAPTGIHYARFCQSNYFSSKKICDAVGLNMRNCLKSYAVESGSYK